MQKRAVVCGVTDYLSPTVKVEAAVTEAQNWANLLHDVFGFNDIALLLDGQATPAAAISALSARLQGAQPDDQIVFVFCGHGTAVQSGPRAADEALLMFHPDGNQRAGALTDGDMANCVNQANPPAGADVTFILDCCFGGGFGSLMTVLGFDMTGVDLSAGVTTLFAPLVEEVEYEELTTVHRFGGLWDLADFVGARPLIIAACGAGKTAIQSPAAGPPHLLFSSLAIPVLRHPPTPTHVQLRDMVNKQSRGQKAVLHGNKARNSNVFLT